MIVFLITKLDRILLIFVIAVGILRSFLWFLLLCFTLIRWMYTQNLCYMKHPSAPFMGSLTSFGHPLMGSCNSWWCVHAINTINGTILFVIVTGTMPSRSHAQDLYESVSIYWLLRVTEKKKSSLVPCSPCKDDSNDVLHYILTLSFPLQKLRKEKKSSK